MIVADWRDHADADWSVPAGTLEWSCRDTAVHVVDTVFAPAFFLASRRADAYPGFGPLEAAPDATVSDLAHGLVGATNLLVGAVRAAPPEVRAIIRRRPEPEVAPPADFVPRGGLELVVHAHDIAMGLGFEFVPPADICERLLDHTAGWPGQLPVSDSTPVSDPWARLLARSGR